MHYLNKKEKLECKVSCVTRNTKRMSCNRYSVGWRHARNLGEGRTSLKSVISTAAISEAFLQVSVHQLKKKKGIREVFCQIKKKYIYLVEDIISKSLLSLYIMYKIYTIEDTLTIGKVEEHYTSYFRRSYHYIQGSVSSHMHLPFNSSRMSSGELI